ncbi:hypothetical protein C7212DRAFT_348181 [Tuber magnatum]|uniref:Uncharacterized protein n=1 Tax=Tuber magnatum TaxID=42249 RepID=A0A317SDH7_9PEZI|nr:hypothetical protein C7212DRAFT_348181 [Tuber magnatum]
MLGTLHRFFALKCDEELLCYLHRVHQVWSIISDGKATIAEATDYFTVQSLQLCAPKHSTADMCCITNLRSRGKLFPTLTDNSIREQRLRRILQVDLVIPSIVTFFEDRKYIEPLFAAMKKLIGRPEGTVFRTLQHSFISRDGPGEVQIDEDNFRPVPGDCRLRMRWGYTQLWLYAMRHFPELVSENLRIEGGESRPSPSAPNLNRLFEFAELAYRLGFDTENICNLRSENPDRKLVRSFVLQARPLESFHHDEYLLDAQVGVVCAELQQIRKRNPETLVPSLISYQEALTTNGNILRRWGRPYQLDYKRDKSALFYDNIHKRYDISMGTDVSSFFVKRALYFSLFGNLLAQDQSMIPDKEATDPRTGPPMNNMSIDIPGPPSTESLQARGDISMD